MSKQTKNNFQTIQEREDQSQEEKKSREGNCAMGLQDNQLRLVQSKDSRK